jgi:23S rRNA maturation-related 3'-5' exoribonuclease YhaM
MKLTAEQIQSNWTEFLSNIEQHITGDRKEKLLAFYKKYEERIILMPAAHKKEYHNAFPGGYVEHVNRVVKAALSLSAIWEGFGADMSTFTQEELVFSAINHDLGKMGDEENESYIPQTDQWRKIN